MEIVQINLHEAFATFSPSCAQWLLQGISTEAVSVFNLNCTYVTHFAGCFQSSVQTDALVVKFGCELSIHVLTCVLHYHRVSIREE